MTWSYGGNVTTSNSDAVRFLTGQTNNTDSVLVTDEEIGFVLSEENNNVYRAAALVAESMSRRYATFATSKQVGRLKLDYSKRVTEFKSLASDLRMRANLRGGQVSAGGLTESGKAVDRSDADMVQPAFRIGMTDDPTLSGTSS